MKKYRLTGILSILLTVCVLLSLVSCGEISGKNYMAGVKPNSVKELSDLKQGSVEVTDFAVRLFQKSKEEGNNILISPLSVLCALSMTANGAKEETLAQMEKVLGLSTGELNRYIYTYMEQLPEEELYKLSLANSIWFSDKAALQVNEDFLQTNADYYDADIFEVPFDDSTRKDINSWVKDKTDGMIPEILDQIPQEAVMYLVNALAFDARWQVIYKEHQVRDKIFTMEDGTTQEVKLMYSGEDLYLEDESATGFVKYYEDKAYAFVALLPKEGISVSEYIATLTGEHVNDMLSNPVQVPVYAAIPKFENEYNVEMSEILMEMGMQDAFFVETADFSGMGSSQAGNIYINRVIHKTYISVGEQGTRAGAATVVEMADGAALPSETKTVYLDRPFVYMLVDCENNLPFFMGTVMRVE